MCTISWTATCMITPPPPSDDSNLLFGDALRRTLLHAEGGEHIAAHDAMLKLGSLRKKVDKLGPVRRCGPNRMPIPSP